MNEKSQINRIKTVIEACEELKKDVLPMFYEMAELTAYERIKKIVYGEEGEEPKKGFEKCSECKYKDADLCKTEPLHEEDEDGNCVDFVKESEYHADPYHADFAWDVKAVIDNMRKESE